MSLCRDMMPPWKLWEALDQAEKDITALRAENERLRAALETTTDDCKNAFHENERLRAALEKHACSCLICERSPEDQDDHCEARAALEEKP